MKCANCGTENREGELICHNCGQLILPATTRLSAKTSLMSPERTGTETATVALVSFDIAGHVYQFPAHDTMKILVGRGTSAHPPTNGVVLDLVGVGSEDNGVSRRHAIVRVQGSETYLVDLGSTNGTFLNGRKVEAHKQHLLYNGDRIHFGRLESRIMLE